MADTTDYNKLAESLESQELDAPNGVPSTAVYEKLLAIYLLQNDIISAKMLWKRIPASAKQQSAELVRLWAIGQQLFVRDRAAVFQSLNSSQWSAGLTPIMAALAESYRERTVHLISEAYSSIGLEDVGKLLGLSQEQLLEKLNSLGWEVDLPSQMVLPKRIPKDKPSHVSSEKQLERLTQYVSFLEMGL